VIDTRCRGSPPDNTEEAETDPRSDRSTREILTRQTVGEWPAESCARCAERHEPVFQERSCLRVPPVVGERTSSCSSRSIQEENAPRPNWLPPVTVILDNPREMDVVVVQVLWANEVVRSPEKGGDSTGSAVSGADG